MGKKSQDNFFEQYRKRCRKCNHGNPVIIPANDGKNGKFGDKIDILFVNERPGPTALIENVISFDNPDSSAWFFRHLFKETFRLKYRKKVFITNAVIWYPKGIKNKNQRPTPHEVRCGLQILYDQIEKLKPKIIVPLGTIAIGALKHLYKDRPELRSFKLGKNIRDVIQGKPIIYPVYHTSLLSGQILSWRQAHENTAIL